MILSEKEVDNDINIINADNNNNTDNNNNENENEEPMSLLTLPNGIISLIFREFLVLQDISKLCLLYTSDAADE